MSDSRNGIGIPLFSLCLFLTGVGVVSAQIPSSAPTSHASAYQEALPPQSDDYLLGPDSQPHPNIPPGKTFQLVLKTSKIFPGTTRTITVYIPAAYTPERPACLYVGLDGLNFNAAVVFDNLIAQHAMPVTIGIGVSPGTVDSATSENPRFDRSLEFDSRNDRMARFLLEEVIPAVESHRTSAGDPILLSTDPNDRAIGGASTGGIGAFTVAWEHPEAFRRVFTAIGTFVGMRGGESYYVQVRKTEPKPLRIFMQDGIYDEWGGGPEIGDWWMSNQTLERALEFAGYAVNHVWGSGTHNGGQAAAVFPEATRWLWEGWPSPVAPKPPGNPTLKSILMPDETWEVASSHCDPHSGVAADPLGRVFCISSGNGQFVTIDSDVTIDGDVKIDDDVKIAVGQDRARTPFAFDREGKLYRALPRGGLQISAPNSASPATRIVAPKLRINSLTVRYDGSVYATTSDEAKRGELWLIDGSGKVSRLDDHLKGPAGVALSPDGLWMFLAQHDSRMGLSYAVRPDGTVAWREAFYDFYVPTWADDSGAGAIGMDRDGRAYVATRAGVEVFDRNGRVIAILPLPGNLQADFLCFGGGNDLNTIFVIAGSKVYRRKLQVHGTPPWSTPIKLPPWGGG